MSLNLIFNHRRTLPAVALLAAISVLLSVLCFAAVASRVKDGESGYGPIADVLGPRWRFLTMWAFYISAIAGGAFMLVAFGSQIRSYVLDDRRVKDHRTGMETGNPERVLDGDLQDFIESELRHRAGGKKKA